VRVRDERKRHQHSAEEKQNRHQDQLDFLATRYGGSTEYLLRISLGWTRHYSRLCMGLEATVGKVQGPRFSCFVVGQWRRRGGAAAGNEIR